MSRLIFALAVWTALGVAALGPTKRAMVDRCIQPMTAVQEVAFVTAAWPWVAASTIGSESEC